MEEDVSVQPSAINIQFDPLSIILGGHITLYVKVTVPENCSALKVLLALNQKLTCSQVTFDIFLPGKDGIHDSFRQASALESWTDSAVKGGYTGRSRDFTGHLNGEHDWSANESNGAFLAFIPPRKQWRALATGTPTQGDLVLEWKMQLRLTEHAELGDFLNIHLNVLTAGLIDGLDRHEGIAVGSPQSVPGSIDFDIQPWHILANSGNVILHGKFNRPLSEIKKQYPSLAFRLSVGEDNEHKKSYPLTMDQVQVHLDNEGKSFTVSPLKGIFSGNGDDGLQVTAYRNVRLEVSHDSSAKPSQSRPLTIIIDNRKPSFIAPKLSVQRADGKIQFKAEGQVQGPDSQPFLPLDLKTAPDLVKNNPPITKNPVTDVAICWTGDTSSPIWIQPQQVPGHENLWTFALKNTLAEIKGMLSPVLLARTTAGVVEAHHIVFPNAIGLVDVEIKVDAEPIIFQPMNTDPSFLSGVCSIKALDPAKGKDFIVKVKINPHVALHAMNVDFKIAAKDKNQGNKSALTVTTAPTIMPPDGPKSADFLQWDGHIHDSVFWFNEMPRPQEYTATFHLNAKPGSYNLILTLSDPEDSETEIKSSFQNNTTYTVELTAT